MTQYHQKKIAMINDLSGYGRCSITAALPVLAALKIQCCPVPTSVLSNHTGFPVYFFDDYTDKMEPYVEKWKELGYAFFNFSFMVGLILTVYLCSFLNICFCSASPFFPVSSSAINTRASSL